MRPMARILVVDDEDDLRAVLSDLLVDAGHEVYEASNGAEALALLEQNPVEVVIADLIMPVMEGIEMIRILRKQFPELKIVAGSGRGGNFMHANLERATHVGADRSIEKPYEPAELLTLVDEMLEEISHSA